METCETGRGGVDGRGSGPGAVKAGRGRDALLTVREATHGSWPAQSAISQAIKAAMRSGPAWDRLTPGMREALEADAMKTARIVCGDPCEPDHWRDKRGYCGLVLEQLGAAP